ncbi:hypothetical protein QQX98_010701 [Neonectria punicea]|uniref:Heterokaryon incompatibility domain-containing protein n=1 Tax=Neonectria punicea TaxID=979145 RepID=A0ABR1GP63_9HYPO
MSPIAMSPYRSLERGYTRVLEIQPSRNLDSPISCKLLDIDAKDPSAEYDALSYTWGAPEFTETITLDGQHTKLVTPTLHSALQRFRHSLNSRRLWVDAVCINQDDDVDKAAQIPLMGNIYRQAACVLVWLGAEAQQVTSLQELDIIARQKSISWTTEEIKIIQAVVGHAWFWRRWVVQEVTLNANVTLNAGPSTMPWTRFVHVLEAAQVKLSIDVPIANLWRRRILHQSGKPAESRGLTVDQQVSLVNHDGSRKAIRNSRDIYDEHLRPSCQKLPEPDITSILGLLQRFHHFGCKDDRDRLYALAHLASDVRFQETGVEGEDLPVFSVSYKDEPERVYAMFARYLVESGALRPSEILRLTNQHAVRHHLADVCSWAPDWRLLPARADIAPAVENETDVALVATFEYADSQLTLEYEDGFWIIEVIMETFETSPRGPHPTNVIEWLQTTWKSLIAALELEDASMNIQIIAFRDLIDILAPETVHLDEACHGFLKPEDVIDILFYDGWLAEVPAEVWEIWQHPNHNEDYTYGSLEDYWPNLFTSFMQELCRTIKGRRLFVTDPDINGCPYILDKYGQDRRPGRPRFGIGPSHTRAGDCIIGCGGFKWYGNTWRTIDPTDTHAWILRPDEDYGGGEAEAEANKDGDDGEVAKFRFVGDFRLARALDYHRLDEGRSPGHKIVLV